MHSAPSGCGDDLIDRQDDSLASFIFAYKRQPGARLWMCVRACVCACVWETINCLPQLNFPDWEEDAQARPA